MLLAQTASTQTLEVKVVDPFSFGVTNAMVAIGDQVVRTDGTGTAVFQSLGTGPHSVVVSAPGFATAIEAVAESEGAVTIELTLQSVSEVIDVQSNVGTRASHAGSGRQETAASVGDHHLAGGADSQKAPRDRIFAYPIYCAAAR